MFRTLAVLFALLLSNVHCCNFALAQQSRSPNANIAKRLGDLEKETRNLREQANTLRADYDKLGDKVVVLQQRVGDDGWKALDATTKLSSLQWQTYGFVLTIILAFSFGGWQGYKLLKDKLELEIMTVIRGQEGVLRHSAGALSFGQLSMGIWNQYSAIPETPGTTAEKKRLLDTAILLSSFAVDHAEKLEPLEKTKFIDLITNIRANHAYWLAEDERTSGNQKNADRATALAKQAFAVASTYLKGKGIDYINRWPDWIESYCFVLSRFGTDAEKLATKEIIRAVCNDVRVDGAWRAQIRKEYGIESA